VRRLPVVLVLAALTAGVVSATTASAAPARATHTRVIAYCTKAVYAPTHYVFFCADGGAGVRNAAYTDWTKTDAHGHGTYYWNDCRPSCAGGTIHHATAMFHLYRVRNSAKYGALFTRIDLATKAKTYHYQFPLKTISDY